MLTKKNIENVHYAVGGGSWSFIYMAAYTCGTLRAFSIFSDKRFISRARYARNQEENCCIAQNDKITLTRAFTFAELQLLCTEIIGNDTSFV